MKVEQINYDSPAADQRLYYVAESGNTSEVVVHCHSPQSIRRDFILHELESIVYFHDFEFLFGGKYIFIYYEDNVVRLIVIIKVTGSTKYG